MGDRKKKNSLADVIAKLDLLINDNAILKENAIVSAKENAFLREQNSQLAARIESLENTLSKRAPLVSVSTSTEELCSTIIPDTCNVAQRPAPVAPELPLKTRFHTLVLSDSIFRHVAGECPTQRHSPETCVKFGVSRMPEKIVKDLDFAVTCPDLKEHAPKPQQHPPLAVKKVVIPGADCDRLFSEAVCLASEFEFEHVYIHVGTNLVDTYRTVEESITEISDLLESTRKIFGCNVTYSPILPRLLRSDRKQVASAPLSEGSIKLIQCIRLINAGLHKFCNLQGFGQMVCTPFQMAWDYPVPDRSLLAMDGCHLSVKGVEEMQFTLFEHIMSNFWVWHGNDL